MPYTTLLAETARNWWTFLLRGIVAVLFAVMAFLWPGLTLAALVLVWGAFALVDGVFAMVTGAKSRWWSVAIFGLFGIAAGLIAFFLPGITALTLLMIVAAWAIVRGVLEIVAAIRLRREISGEWLLVLAGVASIAFGVLMAMYPGAGAVALIWLIGLQALVAGVLLIGLSFRLRAISKRGQTIRPDLGAEPPTRPGVRA
jgi:uncharacterized membrane protein HdeD (DUF308 family)